MLRLFAVINTKLKETETILMMRVLMMRQMVFLIPLTMLSTPESVKTAEHQNPAPLMSHRNAIDLRYIPSVAPIASSPLKI